MSRSAVTGPKRLASPSARITSVAITVLLIRSRRRLAATLRIIEAMIATPRIMLNVYALMPLMFRPSRSTPRTRAPRNAPTTVPEPPASAVPPMTAAAMQRNVRLRASRQWVERLDPDPLADAGESGERGRQHEVADLDPLRLHARLPGADRVAAGGDGVHTPSRVRRAGRAARRHDHDGPHEAGVVGGAEPCRQRALRRRLRASRRRSSP